MIEGFKLNLQAPWYIWARKVYAMFGQDPDIDKILFRQVDDTHYSIDMYAKNAIKAIYIEKLLGRNLEKTFGDTIVAIYIYVPNEDDISDVDILNGALRGNPVFDHAASVQTPFGNYQYALFNNKVLQYYTDTMNTINGVESVLAENLAEELFDIDTYNMHYCTDVNDDTVMDWPN